MKKETKTAFKFMGLGIGVWALIGALGIAGTAVTYALKPVWLGFEREIFVSSHQYQEAVDDAIGALESAAARIEVSIEQAHDDPELQQALRRQLDAVRDRIEQKRRKQR